MKQSPHILESLASRVSSLPFSHMRTRQSSFEAQEWIAGCDAVEIVVPFTKAESTERALCEAGRLAPGLNVRIRVIAVVFVPFAVPFECSPISVDFLENALRRLNSSYPLDREIYLTRDPEQTWKDLLSPGSLIVIAPRRRLWSKEAKLVRTLQRLGHHVCCPAPVKKPFLQAIAASGWRFGKSQ